ncbi:MAG TPA: hypothetical protein VGB95_01505, partial [Chitinophagales bacterium]
MKKLMMLLAVSTFFTASLFAQDSTKTKQIQPAKSEKAKFSSKDRAVKVTAKLDSVVSLSTEQKAKVQAINENYIAKMQANKQEMRTLNQQQRAEIKQVLTPAQLEKLKATKE